VEIPRFWAWIATHSPTEWNENVPKTRKWCTRTRLKEENKELIYIIWRYSFTFAF
jgi:hypothetical protein